VNSLNIKVYIKKKSKNGKLGKLEGENQKTRKGIENLKPRRTA
jgi:hypothetical protein